MKKTLFLIPTLLLSLSPHPAPAAEVLSANLQNTVEYLASPKVGGRNPMSRGHRMTQQFIQGKLAEYGYTSLILNAPSLQPWKGPIENIVTIKPSKNWADRCVVFAAHYDHNPPMGGKYSPGANDNATGVAALLELARNVQEEKLEFDADVYFVFPDQEENFVQGSPFIADIVANKCKKVLFSVTLDLVGVPFFSGFENHLLTLGAESSPDLHRIVKQTNKNPGSPLKAIDGQIFLIEPAGIPRSDYSSFRGANIPFVFLTAGMPATYHTPMDKPELIDYRLLGSVTQWMKSLLINYQQSSAGKEFRFLDDPYANLYEQGIRVAEIMELMLSRPQDNGLTEDDIAWLVGKIGEYRALTNRPSRLSLQWSIIEVIRIVSRQSPMPSAYLRSIIGKIFN